MASATPPDLLVDRSLGLIAVPAFLKQTWPAQVLTLNELFGDGSVEDTEWMAYADENGLIAVCKDGMIRRRKGERELMSQGHLRVFCLANGNLTREAMVDRFAHNLPAMLHQSTEQGPWLYALYSDHIAPLTLYGPRA